MRRRKKMYYWVLEAKFKDSRSLDGGIIYTSRAEDKKTFMRNYWKDMRVAKDLNDLRKRLKFLDSEMRNKGSDLNALNDDIIREDGRIFKYLFVHECMNTGYINSIHRFAGRRFEMTYRIYKCKKGGKVWTSSAMHRHDRIPQMEPYSEEVADSIDLAHDFSYSDRYQFEKYALCPERMK